MNGKDTLKRMYSYNISQQRMVDVLNGMGVKVSKSMMHLVLHDRSDTDLAREILAKTHLVLDDYEKTGELRPRTTITRDSSSLELMTQIRELQELIQYYRESTEEFLWELHSLDQCDRVKIKDFFAELYGDDE